MTEASVIGAALTTIAGYNLKDLTVCNTYLAALEALAVLLTAYTETEIDNDDENGVTAALKAIRTGVIGLVAKLIADHKVKFQNTA